MTAQNLPRNESSLARELADIKRRLRALETAPRAAKTSFSNGKLVVGDPSSETRIEISAADSRIRFYNPDGPADIYSPGGNAGTMLRTEEAAGGTFPDFGAEGYVWNGSYFQSLQVSRIDGDTTTVQASVDVRMHDSGSGHSAGQVSLNATNTGAPNEALINLVSDGGMLITNNGRTTDPPTPPADCVVLYVKSNRLYYKDAGGTPHPL
ncbi:hypothetical protein [Actinoallomurus iriomotensis]|uniref:Uncharacterized protein n=1 Tax=Actinoallomurus iriomotensis TaxID=478107 RepID=A0A9W6RU17_9ACTN|nr:hypothetical protein [Actinoallomurus iriomotensis]GLY81829.1 hypothetical protein Airi01_100960 [Actinoallomurus iriomotensis]